MLAWKSRVELVNKVTCSSVLHSYLCSTEKVSLKISMATLEKITASNKRKNLTEI
jgi:hypothetical protein